MLSKVFLTTLLFGCFQSIAGGCDVASVTTVSGTYADALVKGQICPGDLIFEDTFDKFDLLKWQHELTLGGGGNWEFEWYNNNRTNSYVEEGMLHIKPTLLADETGEDYIFSGQLDIYGGSPADECTSAANYGCSRLGTPTNALNPIKSARIRTVNSFAFNYGKLEVSAKLPAGDWLWPAIWLMPRTNQYGGWPASGEIDVMESRGNKNLISAGGVNIGTQLVGSTLHWGPNYNYNRFSRTHYEKNNAAGFDTAYHKYQLEWTPDHIQFSIDDEVIGSVAPGEDGFWGFGELDETGLKNPWRRDSKMAPFDQQFYIIINLAVGGIGFFPDDATNPGGKPWLNTSPESCTDFWNGKSQWLPTWDMETDNSDLIVDYVRVWAL